MTMTDGELITSFRQAKDQKAQVFILADLNAVDPLEMHKKLVSLGLDPGPAPAASRKSCEDLLAERFDETLARKLVLEGKTEREIVAALGTTQYAFRQWKAVNRIQRPPKPKKKKPETKPIVLHSAADNSTAMTFGQFAEVIFKLAQTFPSATLVRPEQGAMLELKIYDETKNAVSLFVR